MDAMKTDPASPSDSEYQSGNPSQYADEHRDDCDDLAYKGSSPPEIEDGFPRQLHDALLPLAAVGVPPVTLSTADKTWLNYNADEIQLVDSLRNKMDQDLGGQLLNAHGLKRTRYDHEKLQSGEVKNYHNKRRWQRDVRTDDEERVAFETDDTWAAWPMEPWLVPRMGEEKVMDTKRWSERVRVGMSAGEPYKPSEELREELSAATLRFAKERFERRKWKLVDYITPDQEEDEDEVARDMGLYFEVDKELGRIKQGGGRVKDEEEEKGSDFEEVEEEVERRSYRRLRDRNEPVVDADDVLNAERMKPAISHALARLDDLLLALRRNRMAVETRPNSRDGEQSQDGSGSGLVSGGYATDTEPPINTESQSKKLSRSRGRPKRRKLHEIPEYVPLPDFTTDRIPGKRGRPRKVFLPLEGETEQEMMIRVAKEQKKRIPQFLLEEDMEVENKLKGEEVGVEIEMRENGDNEEEEEEEEDEQEIYEQETLADCAPLSQDQIKASDSDSDATEAAIAAQYENWPYPAEPYKERKRARDIAREAENQEFLLKYANRDWSDVIGLAAVIGFPPKVIQRTVKRCTTLLDEKMDLRVFTRLAEEEVDTLVKYRPDKIPSDDGLFESEAEKSDSEQEGGKDDDETNTSFDSNTTSRKSFGTHSRTGSKASSQSKFSNGIENIDSDNELSSSSDSSEDENGYTCPIEDCDRHHAGREISSGKALRAHLRKRHEWSEGEIEGLYEVDTDEDEMLAGVHRDGFLMTMKGEEWYDRRRQEEKVESDEGSEYKTEEEFGSPEL